MQDRIEKDSLGERSVPTDVLYGIYTQRVIDNYIDASGKVVPRRFIENYIRAKKVYSKVNSNVGKLDKEIAKAIIEACDEILKFEDQEFIKHFPIDQIQSGGGTSTNMNVNEVIANLAEEKLGGKRGEYKKVNPNDHVNMSQSSNDTFPGVMRITTIQQSHDLTFDMKKLISSLMALAQKGDYEKVGRTHLQDAVTIKQSDEINAFVTTLQKDLKYLELNRSILLETSFGGTATGSMQNINNEIRDQLVVELSEEFDLKIRKPDDYFETNSSSSDFVKFSSGLGVIANDLIKICSDIRILTSGPNAGINEISLPAVQPGSSIMPGKINPSIPEAVMMICFRIIGNQLTINEATRHAELQLQVFNPIIAFTLFSSMEMLSKGIKMFAEGSVDGIVLNKEQAEENFHNSFVYATDYSEKLGYAKVAELVKRALKEKRNLKELLDEIK